MLCKNFYVFMAVTMNAVFWDVSEECILSIIRMKRIRELVVSYC
jgi:hypothetical protein